MRRQSALSKGAGWAAAVAIMIATGVDAQTPRAVSGLGYVEPAGGVVRVSGPIALGAVAVADLRVSEGDHVTQGQIIAKLDNNARFAAALRVAETEVGIRRARLRQVLAGATTSQIEMQLAVISRISAELRAAEANCDRVVALMSRGTATQAAVDRECGTRNASLQRLSEAEAQLATISGIRPEDVALREAELKRAVAAVALAQAELESTLVRAPLDGQVLVVHAKRGERITERGIVEIGQTAQMWVSAEIYETDIARVSVGQSATIRGDGLERVLRGRVERIGLVVGRNEIAATDPAADVDARVVKVKIAVAPEDSSEVAALTNLQVFVVIEPDP